MDHEQRLIVYRCLADSTWFLHEYQLAESYLKKLLHSYKQLDKTDNNAVRTSVEFIDDMIKYFYLD